MHRCSMLKQNQHVQRVLEQLGEQDSRELIRLLGRITEIEASA